MVPGAAKPERINAVKTFLPDGQHRLVVALALVKAKQALRYPAVSLKKYKPAQAKHDAARQRHYITHQRHCAPRGR